MKMLKVRPTLLKRRNFTMVEILATIAIIAILAGLSFGAYNAIQKGQAKTKTEATLNAIHIALQAFKNKYGYYPQAHNPVALAYCKENDTTNAEVSVSNGTILKSGKMEKMLVLGKDFTVFLGSQVMKNAVIKDGDISNNDVYIFAESYKDPVTNSKSELVNIKKNANLIYYKCPGDMNQESYDLFSAGPDRKFKTGDDLWPQGLKRKTSNL